MIQKALSFLFPNHLTGASFEQYLKRSIASNNRSKPAIAMDHSIDIAFAMTFSKLQGATIQRLIIVLGDVGKCLLGKMCPKKLYVALSRVCKGCLLALFPCEDAELQYLLKIRQDPVLQLWDQHYES